MPRSSLRSDALTFGHRPVTTALAFLAIGFLQGQPPASDNPPETNFRISVNLVQIDATVTDSHGKPIRDLAKSDFEVLLDGKAQPITYFSQIQSVAAAPVDSAAKSAPQDTSVPSVTARLKPEQVARTMVIFVDDLNMSAESVPFVRRGLEQLIDKRIGPGDLTAIVRASAGLGALQDFTTDKAMLRAALDQIRWKPSGRGGLSAVPLIGEDPTRDAGEFGSSSPGKPAYGYGGGPGSFLVAAISSSAFQYQEDENYREMVYTAAALDSLERVIRGMARLAGRKSVVMLSDRLPVALREITNGPGQPRNPVTAFDSSNVIFVRMRDCIDQSARSGVVVDFIDTKGLSPLTCVAADAGCPQGLSQERHELHDQGRAGGWYLARETGGLTFPESNDIGASLSRIYDDSSSYYILGFRPPDAVFERASNGSAIFRRVTVQVERDGVQVRSRSGFMGTPDEEALARPRHAELALESSLDSPFGGSAVDLRLRSSYLSARKNEWLAQTALWVDAHNLTLEGPANNRSGIIHLLVRAFSVNGAAMDGGIDQLLRVSLNEEGYERAMKYGLVYSTSIPIAKPGPYQVRAAILDQASGKIGTANEFLLIPKPAAHGFSLSGIVFPQMLAKDDDITPATGPLTYASGQRVAFAFEVIGAASEKSLLMSTRLFHDGSLVKQSPPQPLPIMGKSLHGSLFAKSEIGIPGSAPPGDYRMQVIVSEADSVPARKTAFQWADLSVSGAAAVVSQ
jgi:VWFA-related protein